MVTTRTKGYTEIVKIADSALNVDKEKGRKYIEQYLTKFPESDLIYPFTALLNGNNNPIGLGHHDII